MDSANFVIPVQQLRGLSIRRGTMPGSWSYPVGLSGLRASADRTSAVAGLGRAVHQLVTGLRGAGAPADNSCPLSISPMA